MITAELFNSRQFRLAERRETEPAPGEVQVRVDSVGICGSDLHYFADGRIGDAKVQFPVILGHEPSGEVLRTGADVSGWSAGDRVALEPAVYCYHCEFCLTGRHNLCEQIRFFSSPPEPGFFRERMNLPARNLLPLPVNVGLGEATLFEPLAVALHSMKFAKPETGDTAAVFGAGPIGLLTIAALKLAGVSRIWVVEPIAHRRELALEIGADAAIDPRAGDAVRTILADTNKRGVDLAMDCVVRDGTHNQSLRVTRSGGRVVLTGIASEMTIDLEFHEMRRKETAIYNVRRSCHESELALRLLSQYPERFGAVVTHTRPLDRIQESFDLLTADTHDAGKIVIKPALH